MKVMYKGTSGPLEKKWQRFMNDKGYDCGTVDGKFGGKTQAATMAFQEANSLVADGIVGKLTVKKAEEHGFEKQSEYTREVNEVIVHITASNDHATIEEIRQGHIQRGFSDIGYHYIVDRDGVIHEGRDVDVIGAHTAGYNVGTVGVSYISRGSDTEPAAPYGKFMTPEQREGLEEIVKRLLKRYGLKVSDVSGHNDYNAGKACPCFKVKKSTDFLSKLV